MALTTLSHGFEHQIICESSLKRSKLPTNTKIKVKSWPTHIQTIKTVATNLFDQNCYMNLPIMKIHLKNLSSLYAGTDKVLRIQGIFPSIGSNYSQGI